MVMITSKSGTVRSRSSLKGGDGSITPLVMYRRRCEIIPVAGRIRSTKSSLITVFNPSKKWVTALLLSGRRVRRGQQAATSDGSSGRRAGEIDPARAAAEHQSNATRAVQHSQAEGQPARPSRVVAGAGRRASNSTGRSWHRGPPACRHVRSPCRQGETLKCQAVTQRPDPLGREHPAARAVDPGEGQHAEEQRQCPDGELAPADEGPPDG